MTPAAAQEIISFESKWEYLNPLDGVDPAQNDPDFHQTWHTFAGYDGPVFSDPSPGLLGYGFIQSREIATDIGLPRSGLRFTSYFRTSFTTIRDYQTVEMEILADDGGVLYLNGEIIQRVNFTGEDRYDVLADGEGSEETTRRFLVDLNLKAGEHTLAFSAHNVHPRSTDIGFDLRMMEAEELASYLEYEETDGQITIVGSQKNVNSDLVIPSQLEGFPVTSISEDAFRNSLWTSVNIPTSVTNIGARAFSGCSELSAVILPEGLKAISRNFFNDCQKLVSVTIPESVTTIDDLAFQRCASLPTIKLPDSLEHLGSNAFLNCRNLDEVVVPEGITSLEPGIFFGCTSLSSINLPTNLTKIGDRVFRECRNLEEIVVPETVISIGDGAFGACSAINELVIPDGVETIGAGAFGGCVNLTDVTWPKLATRIEASTFAGCLKLKQWTIPPHISFLGPAAFEGPGWSGLPIRLLSEETGFKITGVRRIEDFDIVEFIGEPWIRNWTILGSGSLEKFAPFDLRTRDIVEILPGSYEAKIPSPKNRDHFFFRVLQE